MAAEKRTSARSLTPLGCGLVIAIVVLSVIALPVGTALGRTDGSGIHPQVGNNTSVQHEDPQAVDDEGNLSELEGWLSGRLSESLIDCTEGLRVGEYDACNRSNDEYPDWLGKYVNVTRETSSEENNTESFDDARDNQNDYASNVSRFRRTLSAYRNARQNGSTERARTLAHRLQRIASNVNDTGGELVGDYRSIGNGTGRNFTDAVNTTTTITRNVTETADAIEVDQFVDTSLTVRTASRRISFRQPLRVSGELAAANGTALADRRIRLEAGNRIRTTRTNETGAFSLTYRPTVLPLDTDRVAIQYAPSDQSVYRANERTVPVRVEQVEPSLSVSRRPSEAGYNDTLVVSGRVGVNGTGARSVPVSATVAGRSLVPDDRTLRTDSDGRFRLTTRLPAGIPTGQQPLRVSLPLEERALNRTAATEAITVVGTPTDLTVDGSQTSVNGSAVDGPEIRVAGRLTTDSGAAVPNESVTVRLNGTDVGEVRTNGNGRYDTNMTVPKRLFADRSGRMALSLAAVYANDQSNLESSRASTQLSIALPERTDRSLFELLSALIGIVPLPVWAVVAALSAGIGIVLYRRRSDTETDESAGTPGTAAVESTEDTAAGSTSPLTIARDQLLAGNMAHAVAAAYADARATLGAELAITAAHTHWEFLDACRQRGLGHEQLEAFERLTELYERATFSLDDPSEDAATTAIEDAEVVAEETSAAADGGRNRE